MTVARLRSSRALIALPLAAATCMAQQFVEQQSMRFPQPALNEYTNQLAFGDIDKDGDLDIVFANGGGYSSASPPQVLRIFVNNGLGFFTDESAARTGGLTAIARDAEFGDVDGDGDLDIAVATDFSTQPRLLINNGLGFYTDVTGTNLPAKNLGSSHAAFADVDNDGDLDLAFSNGGASRFGSGPTQLYLNDGTGKFTDATATLLPAVNVSQPMDISAADVDGDYDLDLLVCSRGSNSSKLFRNDGSGKFTDVSAGNIPSNDSAYSFDFGDFNNDGALDIIGSNGQTATAKENVFQNNGSGSFTDVTNTVIPGTNNPSVDDNDSRFFDIDYDGDLDLVIASLGSTERILINNAGVYTLTAGVIQAVADASLDIECGDLDNDGDLDLVTGQGESGSFINRIFINTGAAKDTLAPRVHKMELLSDTGKSAPRVVRAILRDDMTTDTNFFASATELHYSVNGGPVQIVPLIWSGGDTYRALIPAIPNCSDVSYFVHAADKAGNKVDGAAHFFAVGYGPADLNGDGEVGQADLGILLADYGCTAGVGKCPGDIDGDGATTQADLGVLLADFGKKCP